MKTYLSPSTLIGTCLGLLAMLLADSAHAQFTYTTNNGTITITRYVGGLGADVTIPNTTNGMAVTAIGFRAFWHTTSMSSVRIPDSVTSIEDSAFVGCSSLTNLVMGNNVTNLGYAAFYYCSSLPRADIPNSIINMGGAAFFGCASLTTITIPNNIMNIQVNAFSGCSSLTNITWGSNIASIGELAFAGCSSLKSLTIPDSVTNIGGSAFVNCTSIANITWGSNILSIGEFAFSQCYSLARLTIPDGVTNIGGSAFEACTSLTSVTIPKSVSSIGEYAFGECWRLTAVYFQGDAPVIESTPRTVFDEDTNVVYYLPATSGWDSTYGGRPTALWTPQVQTFDATFGIRTNQFGFQVNWAGDRSVVVEATTTLNGGTWVPLKTNTFINGSLHFSDPQWTNYPSRFYRIRSP